MWKYALFLTLFSSTLNAVEKEDSNDWSAWLGASADGRRQELKLQSSYSANVNLGLSTSMVSWDFKQTDKVQLRTFAIDFTYFFFEGFTAQLSFGTLFGIGEGRVLQKFQSRVDDGPSISFTRWINTDWSIQKDFTAFRLAYRFDLSENWMGEVSSGEQMILASNSGINVSGSADVPESEQVRLKSYLQRQFRKDLYFYPQLSIGFRF